MSRLSMKMIEAAHNADVERILALARDGESMLGTCEQGSDILFHFLWQSSDPNKLQQLISFGCRPANTPSRGGTPLVAAVWSKSPQLVSLLLANGADPNVIAYVGDDESSALDIVIDDYCDCDGSDEFARMIEIERLIRLAGGRVHSKQAQSGEFPHWHYQ